MPSLRVALLFGGRSTEHEISLLSARAVAAAIAEADGLELWPIAVTGDGRWLDREASARLLDGTNDRAEAPDSTPELRVDVAGRGLTDAAGAAVPVDVLFPLVHGWGGEDGRFQALCELAGLPYVGPERLGSAIAMDKAIAKRVLEAHGVPVCPWLPASRREVERGREALLDAALERLGARLYVKPANGGSSVGISRVDGRDELSAAIDEALRYDEQVLIERALDAREIELALLGNDDVEVAVPGEVVPRGGFYDYRAKYIDDSAGLAVPAELPAELFASMRQAAVTAFRALRLAGMARVDFLVERESTRYTINEINTLPGFTGISMYPRLWAATGVALPQLVRRLVDLGIERAERQRRLLTRWQGVAE